VQRSIVSTPKAIEAKGAPSRGHGIALTLAEDSPPLRRHEAHAM
jgi:hypothetical protein